MYTRRSPRNQERLFRELFKPAEQPKPAVTPIDLSTAWWLSKRTKRQIEADRVREAQRARVREALNA